MFCNLLSRATRFLKDYFCFRDLSQNLLETIGKKLLRGVHALKVIQLDSNQISCLDATSIGSLKDLEVM